MPRLPFEPETIETARRRFRDAFRRLVDVEECWRFPEMTPSKNRDHVFDFEDGLRLICSRDLLCGQMRFHVSASSVRPFSAAQLKAAVAQRLSEISRGVFGHHDICEPSLVTAQGIPHWFFWSESDDDEPAEAE